MKRVCVLGIDCMSPKVVFGPMRRELPTLDKLLSEGHYGILESSFPPTTIPAWMSMFTGKSPGELGVYGFKHRAGHAMTSPIKLVSRFDYLGKPIWEWVSRQGLESVVVGVPSSWPVASLRGAMVSDFTTPPDQRCVYPASHADLFGDHWKWDLENWRLEHRERTLSDLIELSQNYWRVFEQLLQRHPQWAMSILVDIGMDRAHHLFWESIIDDGEAPERDGALWKFYKYIDAKLAEFIDSLPAETSILIVSDHGAQAMRGSFALNQWLVSQGLLKLKTQSLGPVKASDVDWEASTWWGEGGYIGKLHLSPYSELSPTQALEALDARLEVSNLSNQIQVQSPNALYPEVNGYPPTAFVEVSDLSLRCIGSLNEAGEIWPKDNDQGADAANHHVDGLYVQVRCAEKLTSRERLESVYDWIKREMNHSRS